MPNYLRELSGPMRLNNNSSKSHYSVSCFVFQFQFQCFILMYFTVLRSTVDSIL
jgi:hypothetical protein